MMSSIDIIIVNWNSGSYLAECLLSIESSLKNNFKLNRVIVIDNASTDGSFENINQTLLPVTVIMNSENLGFAKASNQGAYKSEADFLLFLNPDTRLFENSLSESISFMMKVENEEIGILGIQIINEAGEISRNCARFPSTWSIVYTSLGLDKLFPTVFPGHFMMDWDHNSSRAVDQVMGSFFFVRRNLFERLSGYDERFFVYYEDLDFAFRARKIGYHCYFLSTAQMFHKGGGTTEKIKAERLFYILQSKLLFCRKHFNKCSYFLIFFISLLLEPFVRIFGVFVKGSFSEVGEIIRGFKKFILQCVK
ncbi:MAG: hypothetical protein A2V66_12740 [Ignavibacteria bacterium RBG_13_36_8]|nr:MAG: hypothetical protein A2V66_12740 [Ignavibacteria bacterium RBG_13_36_8]